MLNTSLSLKTIFCAGLRCIGILCYTSLSAQNHIYIANDNHTDYLWSGSAAQYDAVAVNEIDYYINLANSTAGNASPYQSRYNLDGAWYLEAYKRQKSAAEFEALLDKIRSGHISVPYNYFASTFGGQTTEAVLRGMYWQGKLFRDNNLDVSLVVSMENQTQPLGVASLWAGAGARYSWKGVCGCATDVNKTRLQNRENEMYMYNGIDGTGILTKWNSLLGGNNQRLGGYAEARPPSRGITDCDNIIGTTNYPYTIAGAFGYGWDDLERTTNIFISEAQNGTNGNRQVYVSNEVDFFEHFESTYDPLSLPTEVITYGNEWDLDCAALAAVTTEIRNATEQLRTAEALASMASMIQPGFYPEVDPRRNKAWIALGSYWEHDFGLGGCCTTERGTWQQDLENDVSSYVDSLQNAAATVIADHIEKNGTNDRFYVFNPLGWQRNDFADVEYNGSTNIKVIEVESSNEVPFQFITRNGTQYIRLDASNIPPVGYKVFEIQSGAPASLPNAASLSGNIFENDFYELTVTPGGVITSLKDKNNGNLEFVTTTNGRELNDFGQNTSGTLSLMENGPVSATIVCTSSSPLNHTTLITLYKNVNRVDIENLIDDTFGNDIRTYSFSFDFNNPTVWHEELGAIIKAKYDVNGGHYAGTDRAIAHDWQTINHFADVGENTHGITLSNKGAAFFKLGNSSTNFLDENSSQLNILIGGRMGGSGPGFNNQLGFTEFPNDFSLQTRSAAFDPTQSMKFSLEHQNPLVTGMVSGTGTGTMVNESNFSLLASNNPDVLLWSIKPSEDGDQNGGIVARVWNLDGSSQANVLDFQPDILSAQRTSHVETDIEAAIVSQGDLSFNIGQNGMETYRLILDPNTFSNMAPTASFTATPEIGSAPLSVDFDASASNDPDGNISSYNWDFGDGNIGTGPNPTNSYDSAGIFFAILTVTDNAALTNSDTVMIQVGNPGGRPVALMEVEPGTGRVPLLVNFDAGSSFDVDGNIVNYAWEFGDDSSSSSQPTAHPYDTEGTYTATLIVTDDSGLKDTTTTMVVVLPPNMRPTASISVDNATGDEPHSVNFDASASTDNDGTIVSYNWDFGDGNTGTGALASHTYSSFGDFTAKLIVEDNEGAKDTAEVAIAVNGLPKAVIDAVPEEGIDPLPVMFSGKSSSDPDGQIASYAWDFGDGGTGTGDSLTYTYVNQGTFFASLTVTDDEGATDDTTITITVGPPPPSEVTLTAIDDAYIKQSNGGGNFGSDTDMRLKDAGSFSFYSYVKFDAGNTMDVSEATLRLFPNTNSGSIIVTVYGTSDNWTEGNITAGNASGANTAVLDLFNMQNNSDPVELDVSSYASSILPNSSTIAFRIESNNGNNTQGRFHTKESGIPAELVLNGGSGGNTAPISQFTASPLTGPVPLEVDFSSTSSDSDGVIITQTWDFGDGNTAVGTNVDHVYSNVGSYSARLIVTDNFGASDTSDQTITVEAPNNPPTALFTIDQTSGVFPLTVNVSDNGSSDIDGTIVSYDWDFGEGTTVSGTAASFTYNNPGTYTLTYTVTDDDGDSGFANTTVTVTSPNQSPTAVLLTTPTSGTVPLAVNFADNGSFDPDGTIVSYEWDTGDGIGISGANVNHTYFVVGTYTVTLTVRDNLGATGTSQTTIIVGANPNNNPPIASFSANPTTGDAPLSVDFDASGSSDSDGAVLSYTWDFGDGTTGTGMAPSHTFLEDGTFSVELTVTDNEGATGSISQNIVGNAVPPIASFVATPTSGSAPLSVDFDASASSDPDGGPLTYTWDFGDGNVGTGETTSHIFTSPGLFTVELTVTDDEASTNSTTTAIQVFAEPIANISANPSSGQPGVLVSFDASGSNDPDGGTITSYAWDFGDGTTDSGVAPSHIYNLPGLYTVSVTVTDDEGATGNTTTTIQVFGDPIPSFQANPTSGNAPLLVAFDASASLDPDGGALSYAWDFGDGNAGTGVAPNHTYLAAGSYIASLTVTDDENVNADIDLPIVVSEAPSEVTETFDVIEDAYVRLASGGTNYGSANEMRLKDNGNFSMYSYLKFSATQSSEVSEAILRIFPQPGTNLISVGIYGTTAGWSESSITANNGPASTTALLGSVQMQNSNDPLEIDVTSYASSILNTQSTIAFRIESDNGNKTLGQLSTREADNPAQLVLTTGSSGPPPNQSPIAIFTASPSSGDRDLLVNFSDNGSNDPDGTIVRYDWDFGDGNSVLDGASSLNHTYTGTGTFTASLTVTDNVGATGSSQTTITVTEPAGNIDPVAAFTANPLTGDAPLLVNVDASTSLDSDGAIVSYAWTFGDGNSDSGVTASNTYAGPGVYTIQLTVTDNEGATNSTSLNVTVTDPNASSSTTLSTLGDAYIKLADGNGNFGGVGEMRLKDNGSFSMFAYVGFQSTQTYNVTAATLRLFPLGGSNPIRVDIYGTEANWSEGNITANNAPAANTGLLGFFDMANANDPLEIDVTPYAASVLATQTDIAFRIESGNGNKTLGKLATKENGAGAELEISYSAIPNTVPPQQVETETFATYLEDFETSKGFTIYPNPFDQFIELSFPENASKVNKIDLMTPLGKRVKTWEISNQNSILRLTHNKDLPKGIYILLVHFEEGVVRKRIIKG